MLTLDKVYQASFVLKNVLHTTEPSTPLCSIPTARSI